MTEFEEALYFAYRKKLKKSELKAIGDRKLILATHTNHLLKKEIIAQNEHLKEMLEIVNGVIERDKCPVKEAKKLKQVRDMLEVYSIDLRGGNINE